MIAFVFKWDILERWLSYNEDAAREQFYELARRSFAAPS